MHPIPSLRDFIEGEVERLDRADEAMSDALREAFRLFASPVARRESGWRYDVTLDETGKSSKAEAGFSQGTTAMVLCALATAAPDRIVSVAVPMSYVHDAARRRGLRELLSNASPTIADASFQLAKDVEEQKVKSGTFGSNDPLTLTWLLELLVTSPDSMRKAASTVIAAYKSAVDRWNTQETPWDPGIAGTSPRNTPVDGHAFPALRLVQAERLVKLFVVNAPTPVTEEAVGPSAQAAPVQGQADPDLETARERAAALPPLKHAPLRRLFEAIFQRHVTYSTMSDSRFDPAEMTFALEGMLQTGPILDRGTIARFLEILNVAQVSSAYWRPVNPIRVTSTGFVLHPVGVETALSLLRICELVDADPRAIEVTAKVVPMLERYWEWLRSQRITLDLGDGGRPLNGWRSEHVNQAHTIHIWETSQVVLFVTGFQELIARYVARQGIKAARLDMAVNPPMAGRLREDRIKDWRKLVLNREPVTCLGAAREVMSIIGKAVVEPRINNETSSAKSSVLLFGPPGTGKTTMAKEVAKALGWPFLNVTVSDFLAEGADVEARAKAVFEVLRRQRDVVILFDEIDQLLLDRDSHLYRQQDSIFQLLTPGMLPKLQELRASGTSVFFVATNYEERIDPAIKRRGRIDLRLPVLPYDLAQRRQVLRFLLGEKGVKVPNVGTDATFDAGLERAALASFLLGFSDVEAGVNEATGDFLVGGGAWDGLESLLKASTRSMRLAGYKTRFDAQGEKPQLPFAEFFLLQALAAADGAGSVAAKEIEAAATMVAGLDQAVRDRAATDLPAQDNAVIERARGLFQGSSSTGQSEEGASPH